jgi:hypothetical protein
MGVSGKRHVPVTLPRKWSSGTHYIGGWVGPRPVWTGAENLASAGIRCPDRPARSESLFRLTTDKSKGKGKGFPLQAWCGSWGSRRLRILDRLDIRHCEGGKVVTLTQRPPPPLGVSWYSFLKAESTSGHMVPSVASEKIPSDSTGDRSRDLSTSSAVP